MSLSRLYVVTGKGGVGKSTIAMALTGSLKESGKKVLYNSFDASPKFESLNTLNLPYFELVLEQSMVEYMGRKLKSEMIAKWIMKTPFFSSLLNMLPALNQMILLGHIIDKLEDDPQLHIVIDAPASGHTLSLFQSTHNFKDMFKEGLLVKDIDRMHSFLQNKSNLEIWLTTLPTKMAIQEGIELKDQLAQMGLPNIQFITNSVLSKVPYIIDKEGELPGFLEQKVSMEKEALAEFTQQEQKPLYDLPFFTGIEFEKIVTQAQDFLSREDK